MRSIRRARAPLSATLVATPSKSVTHRALVAAALASSESVVLDPLKAADTRVTRDGLRALGIRVEEESRGWVVRGTGGRMGGGGRIELGESGTSMRFLTALSALAAGPTVLDGASRLRERPMVELVEALRALGVEVQASPSGGLPLVVRGSRAGSGTVKLWSERSSQFASALLLIGSRLPSGITVELEGRAVSLPYVALTAQVLDEFGVEIERLGPAGWRVAARDYPGRSFAVEGDWSSASFFLAAAAIVGGEVRMTNLRAASAQADARIVEILERLGGTVVREDDGLTVRGSGRLPAFDVDAREFPDLVPVLAILGLFAEGPSTVRSVAHLRYKESDRPELLARNLTALGRASAIRSDRLEIGPPAALHGATLATGSDHRLAMAFAVAGLLIDGTAVDDAGCVIKSNPEFWGQLAQLEG